MLPDDCLYDICRCGHFDGDHVGYFWFHMTRCKVDQCNCEKYLREKRVKHDQVPKSAWDGITVD